MTRTGRIQGFGLSFSLAAFSVVFSGIWGCGGEAQTTTGGQGGSGNGSGGSGGGTGGMMPCVSSVEVCDGKDNDCDGQTDEDLGTTTCGVGACQSTVPACTDGSPTPCQPLPPGSETCGDGFDNNCDGAVDEVCPCQNGAMQDCYTGPANTLGTGACKSGKQSCVNNVWGACQGEVVPSTEDCDGLDNNCDGQTDEGNPGGGGVCATGLPGVCSAGTSQCQGGKLTCSATTQPSVEKCDGLDNNCDGQSDEANPGGGMACSTGQMGVCNAGTTQCINSALSCLPNTSAMPETCDGQDNDCDGMSDEGNPEGGMACNTGLSGVCMAGTSSCQNGQLLCAPNTPASNEVCDGLDNNCNGQTDEGNPGGSMACNTGLSGVCSAGTTNCQNGTLACVQNMQAIPEDCNDMLDNDCNGVVNNGCSQCNPNVLILSDGIQGPNQAVANALSAAGLVPTLQLGGVVNYAGAPSAQNFGAVLLIVGEDYATDMSLGGQQSIVDAWNAGKTGVVFTEWAAYKAFDGQWTTLGQLEVVDRSGLQAYTTENQTFGMQVNHPVWAGLPATFTTQVGAAPKAFNVGNVINGGTLIATVSHPSCGCSAPGVTVKEGASRTVQIAHSATWNGGNGWVADANLLKMMVNSALWTTKCP